MRQEWEAINAPPMMQDIGDQVLEEARQGAPVDTGALVASLEAVLDSGFGAPAVSVQATVPYAGFVEFGTYKDAAQPYLRPALDGVVS